jgi:hypothetical protein
MENLVNKHLELLGREVRDRVTNFEGVVISVSFDLYGCIQAVVTPKAQDGEIKDGRWFDVTRLEVTNPTPVMALPDFSAGYVAKGLKGPAEKPAMYRLGASVPGFFPLPVGP